MASPNHKAALAVVVPASDNRSQFTSPRKVLAQSNGMVFNRSSNGNPSVPSNFTGCISTRHPNGTTAIRESNAFSPQHPSHGQSVQNVNGSGRAHVNGKVPQQTNGSLSHKSKGVVPSRRRLLEVEEALQYSPFSSIVPFGSGTSYSMYWASIC
jgi:hypothetical protein